MECTEYGETGGRIAVGPERAKMVLVASMFKSALIVLALALGAFPWRVHAQEEKPVPKELMQYVRDAQKAGLKPPQIRQKALNAGWAGPTVDEAMGTLEGTEKPQPSPESAAGNAVEAPKETQKERQNRY